MICIIGSLKNLLMRKMTLFFLLSLVSRSEMALGQSDVAGSGHAILFDGIDDYVDLGNIYDDIALPITISAWIYVEPNVNAIQYPIFDSQDNSSVYNGFTFVCSTLPHVGFTIGDGRGGNNPAFRRSRAGYFEKLGRWIFVSATARSGNDIQLYMNGHLLSGEYQGSSPYDMNSDSPSEVAKIGYLFSNGLTFRFKGIMDELRIWNRPLSVDEIRKNMCRRLAGNETGLIGYWNFDEVSGDTLKDLSPKGYNGILKGNPTRVFSGAPVGDESVSLYTTDWTGQTLGLDAWTVSHVTGTPYGVHMYKVNHVPSQTGGLNAANLQPPYYGIFLADDGTDNVFDLSFGQVTVCSAFQRKDNSGATWAASETFSQIHTRTEIIPAEMATDFNVDLGEDTVFCGQTSRTLTVDIDPDKKSFLWNTGETSQSITVNATGLYAVEVKENCAVDRDSILISFATAPPSFSLGENQAYCEFQPRPLKPDIGDNEFDFTWQDGSKEKSFQANDFGTYWLNIANACGVATDTISFTRKVLKDFATYNFISPDNNDNYNQYFVVDDNLLGARLEVFNRWGKPVYWSASYHNTWDGQGLPSGVYFYTIQGECSEPQKGTVTIAR